jgi:NitT/TauT family transport system permease protein
MVSARNTATTPLPNPRAGREQTEQAASVATPPHIEQVEASVERRRAARAVRARVSAVLAPTVVVIAALVLWEVGTRAFGVRAFLLPPPSAVVAAMMKHASLLIVAAGVTTLEIVLGFALSIAVGIPLALMIFLWPPFARAVLPLLISSQAMPKVAVAPLLLVWFGFGLVPKVLIAFLIAFFPVVINTAVGLAAIEPEKIHLARSMGLGAWDTFFKIRLPDALPAIFAGLKISITLAVVGAVVGEFVGGDAGLGYLLMVANGSMDTQLLFAGIVCLTILGVALYLVVELIERLAIPRHIIADERAAGGTF